MAENQSVQGTLETIMENLKTMVNSNTVLGDPITTPDGTTIIPVTKISYGFGTGGGNTNMSSKTNMSGFGAGGGGGITVTPVAFLSVKDGVTKLIQVEPFISSVDRVIEKMPDLMDRVGDFIDNKKEAHAAKKAEKKAAKELEKQQKEAL